MTYSMASIRVLERTWRAAGYPWSVRVKAMVPQWLPWARLHVRGVTPAVEAQLLRMSARQMDRCLKDKKRRLYGRTKPGTLLGKLGTTTNFYSVDVALVLGLRLVLPLLPLGRPTGKGRTRRPRSVSTWLRKESPPADARSECAGVAALLPRPICERPST